MDNNMHQHRQMMKEILDLHDYIETIGSDRPKLVEVLKSVAINPKTMWECVVSATQAAHIAQPEYSIQIINHLFKLGVTIGYKAAIEMQMKSFSSDEPPVDKKEGEGEDE